MEKGSKIKHPDQRTTKQTKGGSRRTDIYMNS